MLVFSVLTELGEHFSDIIHKQLGEFLVGLKDETEELAVVVVDDIGQLLLEGKWLKVLPRHLPLGCLQHNNLIVQFKRFGGLPWNIGLILLQHPTQQHDVLGIETECKVVRDPLRQSDLQLSPDCKLCVIALDCI